MDIFMMLILPIHEHGICFRLFVSSFISFFSVVYFSEYKSLISLVRFISTYMIFLFAISNGIFFLISVSAVSLLVYRNTFDFLVLTFYPAVLPNLLIRQSSFWWSLQGFLCTLSCHQQTVTVLLSPFQFGCLLYLFLV